MRQYACILALAAVLGAAVSEGKDIVLLGEKGATINTIAKAVKGLGKIEQKQRDGFYRVALADGIKIAQAKKTLRQRGIDHVFDVSASDVDKKSLPSVRSHIAYLRARHTLAAKPGKKNAGEPEETGVGFYAALEHYLSVRVGPDGKMDMAEMARAIEQREALPPATMGGGPGNAPYSIWSQVGPYRTDPAYSTYFGTQNVSGRVMDIAIFPGNTDIMYISTAGGGIWKTIDSGINWKPCSDKWAYLHTSTVAVHPTNSNIVLAGTGDYDGFFGAQTQGVMRSTDGGSTWTQVGAPGMKVSVVNEIIMNPANPNQVVCATGKGPLSSVGIYSSGDGGLTWTNRLSGADIDDMDIGPTGILWFSGVSQDHLTTGFVYRSNDFGLTWAPTPVNPNVNNQQALDIAASRLNPNTVYLLSTGDETIYKTTNGGTSWADVKGNFPNGYPANTNYNWSQKSYDRWIGCSVNSNQDLVLVGLITIAQSLGGNGVWIDASKTYNQSPPNYVHADQHTFAVDPTNPNTMFFGCDGGIYRYTYSAAPVAANFTSLNSTIVSTQHYQVELHPTDLSYIMSGTQDNSSPSARGNLADWRALYAGDGGWAGFDNTTPAVHFTTSQGGSVWLYTTATDTTPNYISPTVFVGGFLAPTAFGGVGGSDIFLAGRHFQKWISANTWTTMKSDIAGAGNYATTIGKSPTNPSVMYTGSRDGFIWRTLDAGATWKQCDDPNIDRPVGDIAVSWTSTTDVLAGLQGTGPNHLWRCTNTSAAVPIWTNVSGNLPDTPINAVCFDPYNAGRWYVGTDIGVFMTSNSGATWTNLTYLGLPNVHVNALRISKNKAYIYAATFGRGIWRIQTTSNPTAFSISGTVRTVNNGPFSGISLALKKWREYQLTFTNSTPLPIPDNNTVVTSTLPVNLNYPITGGTLYLNITHTYKGDLVVILEAPDGNQWVVHNQTGGSADNIIGNFDFDKFSNGLLGTGTWKLLIRDAVGGDSGTLNSWKVIPKFFTYVTQATTTSSTTGTYSFPGLDAGKYYVIPSFAGKTWTPKYRIMNVGPSRTLQDFKANQ